MNIADIVIKKTAGMIGDIAAKNRTSFDTNKAREYMKKTSAEQVRAIVQTMRADAKQADFAGGIERGKVHQLVKTAAQVSLVHGCSQWAADIYEHSKQEKQ